MDELKWGPVSGWCRISASADKDSYSASEKVYITVVVKNVSNHPARYQPFPFAPEVDYKVSCHDGRPVELTAFGRLMRDSAGESSSSVEELMPGQEIIYEIFLNRRYDLTLAEKYKFEVYRGIETDDRGNTAIVSSNAVEIEIVEQE